MTTLSIPKGLFLEKSKHEAMKIWESIEQSLESLVELDPFDGKWFYALMYMKQETDGTQNRHAYLNVRIIRPQAVPDSALFKIEPNKGRYYLCYHLPAMEHFEAYRYRGALENPLTAKWIKLFEEDKLSDPTDHDFTKAELYSILCGNRYGKSEREVQDKLKKIDSRLSAQHSQNK